MAKSEWTVKTLRELWLSLRKADKTAIAAALSAAERAVAKAEEAAEKRFEGLNELRKVVNDVVATLISRNECVSMIKALEEKAEAANLNTSRELHAALSRLDKSDGKGEGKQQGWMLLVTAVSVIVGLTGMFVGLWAIFHH